MKTLSINGQSLSDYGIYITSDTYLNAPSIDYTEYQIPARDGSLFAYNKRLNDVVRKFTCYIPDGTDVHEAMQSLKVLLYTNIGEVKLESDYTPEYYQLGNYIDGIEAEPFNLGRIATFELYFSCRPQQYYRYEGGPFLYSSRYHDRATCVNKSNYFIQEILKNSIAKNYGFNIFFYGSLRNLQTTSTTISLSLETPVVSSRYVYFMAIAIVIGGFPDALELVDVIASTNDTSTGDITIPSAYRNTTYKAIAIVAFRQDMLTLTQQTGTFDIQVSFIIDGVDIGFGGSYNYAQFNREIEGYYFRHALATNPLYELRVIKYDDVTTQNDYDALITDNGSIRVWFGDMRIDNIMTLLERSCSVTNQESSVPSTYIPIYIDSVTYDAYAIETLSGNKIPLDKYVTINGDISGQIPSLFISVLPDTSKYVVYATKIIIRGYTL